MNLIEVDNNFDKKLLFLDVTLSNVCNYRCWYCWPGSNRGDKKFPDSRVFQKNILHLANYYFEYGNKKMLDIHFQGGEPTHWPKLGETIQFCKEHFPCLISMTSNGSKDMAWWKKYGKYFDRVQLSCHHQYVKIDQFRDLCDWLYDQNVIVSVSVMMDPTAWDKCIENVEYLKKSKRKWTIRYVEIVEQDLTYSKPQIDILSKHRARSASLFWFLKNNKYYRSKVRGKDIHGKTHKFSDNGILLKKLNKFKGWTCSVGINWLHVSFDGRLACGRGQKLFGEDSYYLYDNDFTEKFHPIIQPSVCEQEECLCTIETVMPKKLEVTQDIQTKKTIFPIRVEK
jgi:MoaA/NifB/PqqE/SkfB family radical SAM enzyme